MTGATSHHLLFLPDTDYLVCGEENGTVRTHFLVSRLLVVHVGYSELYSQHAYYTLKVRVLDEKTRGPSTMVASVHKGGVTGLISVCTKWDKNMFLTSGRDGLVRLWTRVAEKQDSK